MYVAENEHSHPLMVVLVYRLRRLIGWLRLAARCSPTKLTFASTLSFMSSPQLIPIPLISPQNVEPP
uniref:SFRICE_015744 n=1 Tax=Spodoptera frugiperda TaxID=7108 RepID=A0A2H1W6V2_SPOFR